MKQDSKFFDNIQSLACQLTCELKLYHDFMTRYEYETLMLMLYALIDKSDDFISD